MRPLSRVSSLVRVVLGVAPLAFVLACHSRESAADPSSPGAKSTPSAVSRPTHMLSSNEARAYGLALINRDRAAEGLGAVELDDVASQAAARHVRDMVRGGFTGHWGTDGSVPELRYTEAGGEDLSTENAGCFADAKARTVNDKGPFHPAEIERFQAAFMNETPPADGHRKNILSPTHNKVGLAYASGEGARTVCVVHEFVDDYGSYAALPKQAKAGDTLHVSGELKGPFAFGGVGLARAPLPKPRAPDELLKMGSYAMPPPFVSYFPAGFKTPKPVEVDGKNFAIDIPLTNLPGPGLYEVDVFVRMPGMGNKLSPVSLRTVRVP